MTYTIDDERWGAWWDEPGVVRFARADDERVGEFASHAKEAGSSLPVQVPIELPLLPIIAPVPVPVR